MNTIIDQQRDNQDFGITPRKYYLGVDPSNDDRDYSIVLRSRQTGVTEFYRKLFKEVAYGLIDFKPLQVVWEEEKPKCFTCIDRGQPKQCSFCPPIKTNK